jgi:hypothetical protein
VYPGACSAQQEDVLFTSALDGAWCLIRFTPREGDLGAHWMEAGWNWIHSPVSLHVLVLNKHQEELYFASYSFFCSRLTLLSLYLPFCMSHSLLLVKLRTSVLYVTQFSWNSVWTSCHPVILPAWKKSVTHFFNGASCYMCHALHETFIRRSWDSFTGRAA